MIFHVRPLRILLLGETWLKTYLHDVLRMSMNDFAILASLREIGRIVTFTEVAALTGSRGTAQFVIERLCHRGFVKRVDENGVKIDRPVRGITYYLQATTTGERICHGIEEELVRMNDVFLSEHLKKGKIPKKIKRGGLDRRV